MNIPFLMPILIVLLVILTAHITMIVLIDRKRKAIYKSQVESEHADTH